MNVRPLLQARHDLPGQMQFKTPRLFGKTPKMSRASDINVGAEQTTTDNVVWSIRPRRKVRTSFIR
jgi:hypothetical protein